MFSIIKVLSNKDLNQRSKMSAGFTLIELLIVIGILSILATVVLLVINPAQMIKQSRDGNRITEINQINKALLIYQAFGGSTGMGTHTKVYVSIPSSQADCSDLSLPPLGGGYTYVCSSSANYQKINGTGWIPVDLTSIQSSSGTLFANLPIDPLNTVANGYYYTYIPGSWALSATMESEKHVTTTAINDGGSVSTRFEIGNNLSLNQYLIFSATVGMSYQGGVVAYVFQSGDPGYILNESHGLITPATEQSSGLQWYNGSNILTGASSAILGSGYNNTLAIISAQGAGSYAAKLCDGLSLNSYADWSLPAINELSKINLNKDLIGGWTTGVGYWSSTEDGSASAKIVNDSGSIQSVSKWGGYRVRCVRYF